MGDGAVVVDDEPLNITHVRNILGEEHIRISCLRSGRVLFKLMQKNDSDMIFVDSQTNTTSLRAIYDIYSLTVKSASPPVSR